MFSAPRCSRLGPRLQRGPGRGTRKAPGAGAETRLDRDGGAVRFSPPHCPPRPGGVFSGVGGNCDGAGRRRLWGPTRVSLKRRPPSPGPTAAAPGGTDRCHRTFPKQTDPGPHPASRSPRVGRGSLGCPSAWCLRSWGRVPLPGMGALGRGEERGAGGGRGGRGERAGEG